MIKLKLHHYWHGTQNEKLCFGSTGMYIDGPTLNVKKNDNNGNNYKKLKLCILKW